MRGNTFLGLIAEILPALGLIVGAYAVFVFTPNCLGGKPGMLGSVAGFCADPARQPDWRHAAATLTSR